MKRSLRTFDGKSEPIKPNFRRHAKISRCYIREPRKIRVLESEARRKVAWSRVECTSDKEDSSRGSRVASRRTRFQEKRPLLPVREETRHVRAIARSQRPTSMDSWRRLYKLNNLDERTSAGRTCPLDRLIYGCSLVDQWSRALCVLALRGRSTNSENKRFVVVAASRSSDRFHSRGRRPAVDRRG